MQIVQLDPSKNLGGENMLRELKRSGVYQMCGIYVCVCSMCIHMLNTRYIFLEAVLMFIPCKKHVFVCACAFAHNQRLADLYISVFNDSDKSYSQMQSHTFYSPN